MHLKLYVHLSHLGILLKGRLWSSRSGIGPEIQHFWKAPRWCWCCWSWNHSLSSKVLKYQYFGTKFSLDDSYYNCISAMFFLITIMFVFFFVMGLVSALIYNLKFHYVCLYFKSLKFFGGGEMREINLRWVTMNTLFFFFYNCEIKV